MKDEILLCSSAKKGNPCYGIQYCFHAKLHKRTKECDNHLCEEDLKYMRYKKLRRAYENGKGK